MTNRTVARRARYEAMRDSFRLNERIWCDRAIELMRAMYPEVLCLVEQERVIRNEVKTSARTFRHVKNTRIAPAINAGDALGYDRKRSFLVGVHRRTQSGKIDNDGTDCLELKRASTGRQIRSALRGRRRRCPYIVHAQPSRQSSGQCLDGTAV